MVSVDAGDRITAVMRKGKSRKEESSLLCHQVQNPLDKPSPRLDQWFSPKGFNST